MSARHIALPQDHGSWVFLFSPLLIGLFAGHSWSWPGLLLVIAALAAFLLRQPVSMAVKAYSGRRPRRDLRPAYLWTAVYALAGLLALAGLIALGYSFVLYLALPGIPVFAWHLYLVSRRAERRQIGVEIVGSGVLALAAAAAFWVGRGYADPMGWVLFGLAWLQSAASIVYAYLRLEQRLLEARPERRTALRMGRRALAYTTFNLLLVGALSASGFLPPLLAAPYALQWGETLWGIFNPAIKVKPTRIGLRQLAVSTTFTVLFILCWGI